MEKVATRYLVRNTFGPCYSWYSYTNEVFGIQVKGPSPGVETHVTSVYKYKIQAYCVHYYHRLAGLLQYPISLNKQPRKIMWIDGNKYSSKIALTFSKTVEILQVDGPLRNPLVNHRGWRVQVLVLGHSPGLNDLGGSARNFSIYTQDHELWVLAFIRATYYRINRLYHNFRFRKYH